MKQRIWCALVAAMIGMFVLSGCGADSPAPINGYQPPGADDRILVLQIRIGDNDTVKKAKVVKETDREVQVEVPVQVDDSVGSAVGVLKNVTVTLKKPLGTRTVKDSTGAVINVVRPVPTE